MARSYFSETQKFNSKIVIGLILISTIAGLGPMLFVTIRQLSGGEPIGDQPMGDFELMLALSAVVLILVGANYVLFASRLVTEVNDRIIRFRFSPFMWKWREIAVDDIVHYELQTNKSLFGFGRYGVKKNFINKKTSLIASGNQVLYLEEKNGKKWIIGTQKPEELKHALDNTRETEEFY